jgi:hypothetical protein
MLSQYEELMLTLPAVKQLIQKLFNAKEALSITLALNVCALNLRNYGKTA